VFFFCLDHQRVQPRIRECCCVLASGALSHNSELADLACNSVWADEHHEGCLLHPAAYLSATPHHMVPQVLQEPFRACFPQVPSRGSDGEGQSGAHVGAKPEPQIVPAERLPAPHFPHV
jgi:hypothetical protein